jgi:hypothetical protein
MPVLLLPDREEFEKLKFAVHVAINEQEQKTADTEQKVTDTLQPLSELLNELKKVKIQSLLVTCMDEDETPHFIHRWLH